MQKKSIGFGSREQYYHIPVLAYAGYIALTNPPERDESVLRRYYNYHADEPDPAGRLYITTLLFPASAA